MSSPRAFAGLFAAVLAIGLVSPASAMTFEPGPSDGVILAHGPIQPGDADRLRALLDENFRFKYGGLRPLTLHLHSPGGSVLAGIELANYVRERGLMTHITAANGCYSACTFVFMGGVHRTALGEFGIHAMSKGGDGIVVYSDRDLAGIQLLASTLLNLAQTLVGDSRVIAAMLKVPAETIHVASDQELVEWRIITAAMRTPQRMKASFDCGGQGLSPVELTVCGSLALSDADRRLAAAHEWLAKYELVKDLAEDQDRWKKYRDSCRHVVGPEAGSGRAACVQEAYDIRLRQLEGLMSFHEANTRGPAAANWKEHAPSQDITTIRQRQQ